MAIRSQILEEFVHTPEEYKSFRMLERRLCNANRAAKQSRSNMIDLRQQRDHAAANLANLTASIKSVCAEATRYRTLLETYHSGGACLGSAPDVWTKQLMLLTD